MLPPLVLRALLGTLSFTLCAAVTFENTGPCKDAMQNIYKYEVRQSSFEKENQESVTIVCFVTTTCKETGTYGDQEAHLYSMTVSETKASGGIFDKKAISENSDTKIDIDDEKYDVPEGEPEKSIDKEMAGWFKFVQTEDGSIPLVFHSNTEDSEVLNMKKAIAAAFQANFKHTASKVEADPQSVHVAKYTYEASSQDEAEGIVRMHRTITSKEVKDYATHIPGDGVALDREEDMVFKKGVITHATGFTTAKMMPKKASVDNSEGDSLEAEMDSRKRRGLDRSEYFDYLSNSEHSPEEQNDESRNDAGIFDGDGRSDYDDAVFMDEVQSSYDSKTDLPEFDAHGTYSLDLVSQRRLLSRERREAVNHLELPEATSSTLLAHIDHTRVDINRMTRVRLELKDICQVLDSMHSNPKGTSSVALKIEQLISLEAKYGSLPGYTPVIDTVITYLQQLIGSVDEHDSLMRAQLYFMLSKDGSSQSQKALVSALESAVDNEEEEVVVVYIAFTENPQPQLVSKLEEKIGSDVHSADTLLLAYGALVAKASPDLQQHMTLFLLSRLPLAATNTSSLTQHILSLGNTESHLTITSLVDYLQHPDEHVQLTSIYALRYVTGDSLVQKALSTLVSQSNASDEHLATVFRCLLSGVEHALNTYTEPPFNSDFASALFSSVMASENSELLDVLTSYLQLIDTPDSQNLLSLLMDTLSEEDFSNRTRHRRGAYWAEKNGIYDLISPLSTRQNDLRAYPYHKSYIWGKRFGVEKGNIQVAAGGFVGASKYMRYKVFGRAKAVAQVFGRTATALDFLALHEKTSSSSSHSKLFAEIVGKTLLNIDVKDGSSACKQYERSLYNSRKYTLFNFHFSVFIYVGTLHFSVAGYVKLSTYLHTQFCEKKESLSGSVGLVPTITFELVAAGIARLALIAQGGIEATAVFNYKVTPKLSTEVCYTNYNFRVKNCASIHHQWVDNKIMIDTFYQLRKIKKCRGKWGISYPCGFEWGSKRKWNALSTSWSLPSSPQRALFYQCDGSFVCNAASSPVKGSPVSVGDARPLRVSWLKSRPVSVGDARPLRLSLPSG